MRWLGGRGVGVDNHSPWSYAGADEECLHGRYGVGVGNHSPCISDDGARKVSERWSLFCILRDRLLRLRTGRMKIGELAVHHAVAEDAIREAFGKRIA